MAVISTHTVLNSNNRHHSMFFFSLLDNNLSFPSCYFDIVSDIFPCIIISSLEVLTVSNLFETNTVAKFLKKK